MFIGEFDEDVFEGRSERADFRDDDALFQQLFAEMVEVEIVVDERVDGLAEDCGACGCPGEYGRCARLELLSG